MTPRSLSSRIHRFPRVIATVCALSMGVAACGSDKPAAESAPSNSAAEASTAPKGPSLTTAQASMLARILLKNHEAGGAKFDGEVQFGTAATFRLKGVVDWKNAVGRIELTTKRSDNVEVPVQTILWGGSSVFLSAPGLTEALAARGHPGIAFLQRPVSIRTNPLDQVITLIASFSSARAENPLLLRQGDTSFGGVGTVRGRPIQKLRFGRSTYSVADDGFAYQIDTRFVSIDGPIVIVFTDHGPKTLDQVDPTAVLPLAQYADVYNSLVGSGPASTIAPASTTAPAT